MRLVTLLVLIGTVWSYCAYASTVSVADLPECGQVCVNNALSEVTKLQRPLTAVEAVAVCPYVDQDFHKSIRDCAKRSCITRDEENKINSWMTEYCQPATLLVARSAVAQTATSTTTEQSSSTSSESLSSDSSPTDTSTPSSTALSTSSQTKTKSRTSTISSKQSSSSISSSSTLSGLSSKILSTLSTLTTSTITTSATSSSTSSSSFVSSTSTTPTSTSTPSAISSPQSPSLSTSAKAAILGSILGAALFLSCIAFIVWHHARRSRKAHEAHNITRRSMSPLDFNQYMSVSNGKINAKGTAAKKAKVKTKVRGQGQGKGLLGSVKEMDMTTIPLSIPSPIPIGRWIPSHSGGYVYSEVPNPSERNISDVAVAINASTSPFVRDTGAGAGMGAYEMNQARRSW